jgi:hypothetical protein
VFVCVVLAAVTTMGTTVETTIGAIPGAKPTPKAAMLTASSAGEASLVSILIWAMLIYVPCRLR